MPALPSEIGPVYDILLQTRDGGTIPCLNKDGKLIGVSQMAYCTSIDRQQQQHEETELQHKDGLIQLSSPNLIDREFTQWPQVTQGDWSGGIGQRVFTGATPISGGIESDPSRYWDGEPGLVWPLTDDLPMQPYLSAPLGSATSALAPWVNPSLSGVGGPGVIGGFLSSSVSGQAPGEGFFAVNGTTGASPFIFTFWSNGQSWSNTAGAGSRFPLDLAPDPRGAVWWINSPDGVALNVYSGIANGPNTLSFSLQDTILASLSGATMMTARMASSLIGNQAVVAVAVTALTQGAVNWTNLIKLYFVGGPAAANTVLQFPTLAASSFSGPASVVTSMTFLGDQLIIALSDYGLWGATAPVSGTSTTIVSYSLSSNTYTTLAQMRGVPNAVIGSVSGALFIVSQALDMFLLQGSSLQYITTLPPPAPFTSGNFQWSVSRPASFGPYAVFAIAFHGQATTSMQVYAYDAVRGRLFKVKTLTYPGLNKLPQPGFQIATFSFWQQATGAAFNAYFNIAVPVDDVSAQTQAVQILHFGVLPQNVFQPLPFQQGTDVVSSLIDFTSATIKNYRQIVAEITPLSPNLLASLRVKAWLNQDPANLNSTPDFDTGIINGSANPGLVKFSMPINRMAKKLVYEATTTGGQPDPATSQWVPAPRLLSISVQAATGWVQTLKLDLSPNVQINSKNGSVWQRQSAAGQPAIDCVLAYNFLKQLWRQRGGEVSITLPNSDSGNWVIEDLSFDSPKPYALSFRADQQSQIQQICTIKVREDV